MEIMRVLKGMHLPKIRGFATHVANHKHLGIQCPWHPDQGFRISFCLNGQCKNHECGAGPCSLGSQWNFGNKEPNYTAGLVAAADQVLGWDAHIVIVTGRNGVVDHRSKCNRWCNPRGSGAGVKSTVDTASSSLVDAYFWLTTPGESDGCTDILPEGGRCPRFDYDEGSEDSLGSHAGEPPSPEAGPWFEYQVKELAANANFEPSSNGHRNSGPLPGPAPPGHAPPGPAPGPAPGDNSAAPPSDKYGPWSAAFCQCGGTNWNGPTCCQSGCRCRHEGEWYRQCEPPAGNRMCGGVEVVIYEEQGQSAHLLDRGGSAVSPNQATVGFAMMLVMGAVLAASKLVRRHQQPSGGMERGTFLRSQYKAEEDTEDEQMHVE